MNSKDSAVFPEGMEPIGKERFNFGCHAGVSCFTSCCRKLDMYLYPYDIIRLKRRLAIHSEEFMRRYTRLGQGSHPFFPAVMMRMADNEEQTCPFLLGSGCDVYEDRPTSCRTYPLERAVARTADRGRREEHYFMTRHHYCMGHQEDTSWTVKEWIRDQKLVHYNYMNELWTEVDTLFSMNPWQGEGAGGPRQQLAFMVCYNIDGFRSYVERNDLLQQFKLPSARLRRIKADDEALLQFGFDWLLAVLGGKDTLTVRK
jgi:Fe-S-cluster containining protein